MTPLRGSRTLKHPIRVAMIAAATLLAALLLRPSPLRPVSPPEHSTAFRWDADHLFAELETEYVESRSRGLVDSRRLVENLTTVGAVHLAGVAAAPDPPYALLDSLVAVQFALAVQGAAHPALLPDIQEFIVRVRRNLMQAAVDWPLDRRPHESIYRVLYGGRIALDEATIQAGPEAVSPILEVEDIPSATPSVVVEGVRVHSGDILLSRGGAPTSALIARGNDFPNVFSHAALAYVDPETGEGTVVESLIERGAVTSSVEDYLHDKKHRILVLRLRPNHPSLDADPLLPHHAAAAVLERVRTHHIPYDFAMRWEDPTAMFCSEIVYHAYRDQGIELWPLRASMSSPGLVRWLGGMGVREFTSLVPSDVEMDPQVRSVAEWRDTETLMDFRLDNAILDVLLERAEDGTDLGYAWYELPAARVLKGYSVLQLATGQIPRIPEGMTAAAALRVNALVSAVHPTLKRELARLAAGFRQAHGYEAPYWDLVDLARTAFATVRDSLPPALVIR